MIGSVATWGPPTIPLPKPPPHDGRPVERPDLVFGETDAACSRCGLRYVKAAGVSCVHPQCPVQVRSTQ